jgi:hypothetical protein
LLALLFGVAFTVHVWWWIVLAGGPLGTPRSGGQVTGLPDDMVV